MPIITALGRWRKDFMFEASLSYIERTYLKKLKR
jgi:hypothetical protein